MFNPQVATINPDFRIVDLTFLDQTTKGRLKSGAKKEEYCSQKNQSDGVVEVTNSHSYLLSLRGADKLN